MHKFLSAIFVCLSLSLSLFADDLSDGFAAAENGDYKTAMKLWKPLAEQGDAYAQYNLGVIYINGYGVPEDDKEAVKWYRLAAEQGHAIAQNTLGTRYEKGEGVIINYTEAARLFNLSARQGNKYGMYNLARMYSSQIGYKSDNIYAYMWFNLADEAGHSAGKSMRDSMLSSMTTKEIRIAQELSQKCLDSNYKKCESSLPNFLHRKLNLSSEDKD